MSEDSAEQKWAFGIDFNFTGKKDVQDASEAAMNLLKSVESAIDKTEGNLPSLDLVSQNMAQRSAKLDTAREELRTKSVAINKTFSKVKTDFKAEAEAVSKSVTSSMATATSNMTSTLTGLISSAKSQIDTMVESLGHS